MTYMHQGIHYTTWLSRDLKAPWITLLNGHTRTLKDFTSLGRFLNETKGFSVLAFDHLGAGQTFVKEDFSLQDMMAVPIALWDHLQIKKTHLLGISMGGVLAQILIRQEVERVLSGVFVSTFFSAQDCPQGSWERNLSFTQVHEKLSRFVSSDYTQKNPLILDAMAKQMEKELQKETYVLQGERQRKAVQSCDYQKLQNVSVKQPVFLIHGSADQVISMEAFQRMELLYPKAQKKIYEHLGHLLLLEAGQMFMEDLSQFFDFISSNRVFAK